MVIINSTEENYLNSCLNKFKPDFILGETPLTSSIKRTRVVLIPPTSLSDPCMLFCRKIWHSYRKVQFVHVQEAKYVIADLVTTN